MVVGAVKEATACEPPAGYLAGWQALSEYYQLLQLAEN